MTTLVSNLPVTQRNTPSLFDRFFNDFVSRPWDATEPVATNGWRLRSSTPTSTMTVSTSSWTCLASARKTSTSASKTTF